MKVHANILDTILNTPTHASKTASANLGDLFLDADTRSVSHGQGAWASKTASVIESEGALAEAFESVTKKQGRKTAAKKAARFKTLSEAIAFAQSFEGKKLAGHDIDGIVAAGRRLETIAKKTAAQMEQDGASKLADYFDPMIVPAWAKQAQADMKLLQSVRNRMTAKKTAGAIEKDADVIKERQLSDSDVKGYVDDLLNQGIEPKQVLDKLAKLADLQLFNKGMATEYLNDRAGLLGLAYLEPNHYMNDCEATAKRLGPRMSKLRAASVKQVAACEGCQYFKQNAGQKTCGLYARPVVANGAELMPIINHITGGAKDKKAALVRIANNEHLQQPKQAATVYGRTGAKGQELGLKAPKEASQEFTAKEVLAMHNSGENLKTIYAHGSKVAGVKQARQAVEDFVGGLNGTQTKVALSQIDCTFLKGKLGSSNAIYGEKKCASCTYRKGMHCGLTGGTLVTFPGMEKTTKQAAARDGASLVKEFGLTERVKQADIQMLGTPDAVELGESKMDL